MAWPSLQFFSVFLQSSNPKYEKLLAAWIEPMEIFGGRLTSCLEFRTSEKVYPALAESWLSFGWALTQPWLNCDAALAHLWFSPGQPETVKKIKNNSMKSSEMYFVFAKILNFLWKRGKTCSIFWRVQFANSFGKVLGFWALLRICVSKAC